MIKKHLTLGKYILSSVLLGVTRYQRIEGAFQEKFPILGNQGCKKALSSSNKNFLPLIGNDRGFIKIVPWNQAKRSKGIAFKGAIFSHHELSFCYFTCSSSGTFSLSALNSLNSAPVYFSYRTCLGGWFKGCCEQVRLNPLFPMLQKTSFTFFQTGATLGKLSPLTAYLLERRALLLKDDSLRFGIFPALNASRQSVQWVAFCSYGQGIDDIDSSYFYEVRALMKRMGGWEGVSQRSCSHSNDHQVETRETDALDETEAAFEEPYNDRREEEPACASPRWTALDRYAYDKASQASTQASSLRGWCEEWFRERCGSTSGAVTTTCPSPESNGERRSDPTSMRRMDGWEANLQRSRSSPKGHQVENRKNDALHETEAAFEATYNDRREEEPACASPRWTALDRYAYDKASPAPTQASSFRGWCEEWFRKRCGTTSGAVTGPSESRTPCPSHEPDGERQNGSESFVCTPFQSSFLHDELKGFRRSFKEVKAKWKGQTPEIRDNSWIKFLQAQGDVPYGGNFIHWTIRQLDRCVEESERKKLESNLREGLLERLSNPVLFELMEQPDQGPMISCTPLQLAFFMGEKKGALSLWDAVEKRFNAQRAETREAAWVEFLGTQDDDRYKGNFIHWMIRQLHSHSVQGEKEQHQLRLKLQKRFLGRLSDPVLFELMKKPDHGPTISCTPLQLAFFMGEKKGALSLWDAVEKRFNAQRAETREAAWVEFLGTQDDRYKGNFIHWMIGQLHSHSVQGEKEQHQLRLKLQERFLGRLSDPVLFELMKQRDQGPMVSCTPLQLAFFMAEEEGALNLLEVVEGRLNGTMAGTHEKAWVNFFRTQSDARYGGNFIHWMIHQLRPRSRLGLGRRCQLRLRVQGRILARLSDSVLSELINQGEQAPPFRTPLQLAFFMGEKAGALSLLESVGKRRAFQSSSVSDEIWTTFLQRQGQSRYGGNFIHWMIRQFNCVSKSREDARDQRRIEFQKLFLEGLDDADFSRLMEERDLGEPPCTPLQLAFFRGEKLAALSLLEAVEKRYELRTSTVKAELWISFLRTQGPVPYGGNFIHWMIRQLQYSPKAKSINEAQRQAGIALQKLFLERVDEAVLYGLMEERNQEGAHYNPLQFALYVPLPTIERVGILSLLEVLKKRFKSGEHPILDEFFKRQEDNGS